MGWTTSSPAGQDGPCLTLTFRAPAASTTLASSASLPHSVIGHQPGHGLICVHLLGATLSPCEQGPVLSPRVQVATWFARGSAPDRACLTRES